MKSNLLYLLRMLEPNNSGIFFGQQIASMRMNIVKKFGWFCSEMFCLLHALYHWSLRLPYVFQSIHNINLFDSVWKCVALRPRNINWQDWKYTSFFIFIVTVKILDVTVQWAAVVVKNIGFIVEFQSTCVYAMNREKFCRINFLNKIQIYARH